MEFAILFILAFLIGLAIYWWRSSWIVAVLVPMALFAVSVFIDSSSDFSGKQFSLMFGLPIIFFAALLGSYVLQIFSATKSTEQEHSQDNTDN